MLQLLRQHKAEGVSPSVWEIQLHQHTHGVIKGMQQKIEHRLIPQRSGTSAFQL
jgi:hypothetical protein